MSETPQIAVIGAGLAGLTCAKELRARGIHLTVIEKSGDIGGRLATRRRPVGRWNHGAPVVHVSGAAFKAMLASTATATVASEPTAASELTAADSVVAYTGVPDMREMLRPMQNDADVIFRTEALALRREAERWWVITASDLELGPYDVVLMTQPAPQIRQLFSRSKLPCPAALDLVEMSPCWALLLGFPDNTVNLARFQLRSPFHAAYRNQSADDPCRDRWVLHATASWSRQHLSCTREEAECLLIEELDRQLREQSSDHKGLDPTYSAAHRWRYARSEKPLGRTHLWLHQVGLGMAGDWCIGKTAECAYLSGSALSRAVAAAFPAWRGASAHA